MFWLFSPGLAGILSRTGGAAALEMLAVTMMTKLLAESRGNEHVRERSASQTARWSDVELFLSVLLSGDLEMDEKLCIL